MTAALNDSRPPSPLTTAVQPADRAIARAQPSVPLDSNALLQGGKAITIHHNGEFYRLQTTRQGKLILTK